MGNWWGNPCISHMMKYTAGWESNGKKHLYYGKSRGTIFPGFAHLMVFAEFSHAIGYWSENQCISHIMKSTIGWESNGKKHPFYGKSVSTSFPGPPLPYNGFCCIFCWENSCISHVMKYTTGWQLNGKKAPILREKYEYQFPRSFPNDGFSCIFSCYGKLMRRPVCMSYGWSTIGCGN